METKMNYQFEPELQMSVRQASWTFKTQGKRLLLLSLLLAVLLIGGYGGYHDSSDLYALSQHGKEVTAQVTDSHVYHGKSTTYTLMYRFQGGGEEISGSSEVSRALYESATGGTPVLTVTYLPSNPSIHRLDHVDVPRFLKRTAFWILGVSGITAILMLIVVAAERDYRRQMRLAVSGVPTMARITECKPPEKSSKTGDYILVYEFADTLGIEKIDGWVAPGAIGKQLKVGQNVTVLYDPDNLDINKLYMAMTAVRVEGAQPFHADRQKS